MRAETAVRLLQAAGVRRVRFEIADTHGIARSKTVPLERFTHDVEHGVTLYGGILLQDPRGDDVPLPPGPRPDFLLRADLDTLVVLPHAPGEARIGGDLSTTDGRPVEADARRVLRRVLARYEHLGLVARTGVEYEFYLLDAATWAPVFPDPQVYATLRNAARPDWRDDLLDALPRLGIDVSAFAAENAPGQYEITFAPADGVAAADQAFVFRTTVKEISLRHALHAPFMSKPFADAAGSGCHLHHSLLDARTGSNRLAGSPDGPLSTLGRAFVAGIVEHAPALCALLAPTPNDFKRFRAGAFAPVAGTWGVDDRAAAARVVDRDGSGARVENRLAGAAANPYIAVAASLAGGLLGLQAEREPPPPGASGPSLPTTLDVALDALEEDAGLRDILGDEFVRTYLLVKRNDVARARAACADYATDEWRRRVDDWERREYGELI
ncbi:MAG TPA: glutamine synthetase family protein [Thermomicrobiaceae bacterium]|nr:glutamine synthetase family protein [Thermomicrobiaceae bacterium]